MTCTDTPPAPQLRKRPQPHTSVDRATTPSRVADRPTEPPRLGNSIEEAAHRLGSSRANVYKAISDGLLRARKFGRRTIILEEDLLAFARELPDFAAAKSAAPRRSSKT